MHYGGSKKVCMKFKNEPYMTRRPSNRTIPDNKELSILDIQTLKEFYATPGKWERESSLLFSCIIDKMN